VIDDRERGRREAVIASLFGRFEFGIHARKQTEQIPTLFSDMRMGCALAFSSVGIQ
jgi:hypothetical protein